MLELLPTTHCASLRYNKPSTGIESLFTDMFCVSLVLPPCGIKFLNKSPSDPKYGILFHLPILFKYLLFALLGVGETVVKIFILK